MKKRLQAILAAFMVVFLIIVDCTPMAGAVAPLVLVEAALASYVASTGYKLYVDNGTGSDLLVLVSDLYDTYLETHPTDYTLLALAQGNFVYNDNSGNIIISQTAADVFQSFSDWIQTEYSVSVDSSPSTVVPATSSYYLAPNGAIAYRFDCNLTVRDSSGSIYYMSSEPQGVIVSGNNTGSYYYHVATSSPKSLLIASYNNDFYIADLTPNSGTDFVFGGIVLPSGLFDAYTSELFISSSFKVVTKSSRCSSILSPSSYSPVNLSASVFVPQSSGSSLAVSLAQNVIDKASDVAQDKALVLDVGASAGDTAEEIADAVVSGYDNLAGTIPVTDTVVATEVIDTPVQEYPDFNDLGLPQLGLALVERFPFCIPYDFVHLVSLFDAEPVAPYIQIDLFPSSFRQRIGLLSGQAVFVLDMTSEQYATLGIIMRWGSLVGFCVGLMFLTKRLIWTS